MATKIKKGKQTYWIDPNGIEIPATRVTPAEKKEDMLVEKVHKMCEKLQAQTQKVKSEMAKITASHLSTMANKHNVEMKGKGNVTFKNFDGSKQVSVKIDQLMTAAHTHFTFDVFFENVAYQQITAIL